MALAAKDIPVTRADMVRWLAEYKNLKPQPDLKRFIAGKLNNLGLSDMMVDTAEHESLDNETSLLDMVMADLPSYGY